MALDASRASSVSDPLANVSIRAAGTSDLPELLRLQLLCHPPHLQESEACFRSILEHALSWIVWDAANDRPSQAVAYILLHFGSTSTLGQVLPPQQQQPAGDARGPTARFLHDVVVTPAWRGSGLGKRLVHQALHDATAAECPVMHLVAMDGTQLFWTSFGFAPVNGFSEAATYGGATHMAREGPFMA